MKKFYFGKPPISVRIIGKKRFWLGIAAGIITALIINYTFNHFNLYVEKFNAISSGSMSHPSNENDYSKYFIAALASFLGLSMALWIWIGNINHKRPKDRIYKSMARAYIMYIFWLTLIIVAKINEVLYLFLYRMPRNHNSLDLFRAYPYFFVLIPVGIFLYNWFIIRMVYRTRKWPLYTFLACLAMTFFLSL